MLAEKYGGKVMERGNFTRQAIEAMEYAKEVAISFGMNYIGTEHLLAGISKVSEGVAANILYNYNLVYADIMKAISEDMGIEGRVRTRSRSRNLETTASQGNIGKSLCRGIKTGIASDWNRAYSSCHSCRS